MFHNVPTPANASALLAGYAAARARLFGAAPCVRNRVYEQKAEARRAAQARAEAWRVAAMLEQVRLHAERRFAACRAELAFEQRQFALQCAGLGDGAPGEALDALPGPVAQSHALFPSARAVIADEERSCGLGAGLIYSASRTKAAVAARARAAARLRRGFPDASLPKIGIWLGERDHTTVMHLLKTRGWYDAPRDGLRSGEWLGEG